MKKRRNKPDSHLHAVRSLYDIRGGVLRGRQTQVSMGTAGRSLAGVGPGGRWGLHQGVLQPQHPQGLRGSLSWHRGPSDPKCKGQKLFLPVGLPTPMRTGSPGTVVRGPSCQPLIGSARGREGQRDPKHKQELTGTAHQLKGTNASQKEGSMGLQGSGSRKNMTDASTTLNQPTHASGMCTTC